MKTLIKNIYDKKAMALGSKKEGEFLFAQDLLKKDDNKIVKRFYNMTYKEVFSIIENDSNLYEHYGYEENQKIKFFIDIDYKIEDEYNSNFNNKEDLLNEIIREVDNFLKSKGIDKDTNKVILDASTKEKYSYHIIYANTIFNNVTSIKKMMKSFDIFTKDKYDKIVDTTVYGDRCLRLPYQSKILKNNRLQPIKNYNIEDMFLLANNENKKVNFYDDDDESTKNIKNIIKNIKPTDLLNKTEINKEVIKVNKKMLREYLLLLKDERSINYKDWLNVLFALKCENTNEFYELFVEFSKRGNKKFNENENLKIWNNYKPNVNSNLYTYNSILYWAYEDNTEECRKLNKKYTVFEDKEIEIKNKKTIEQEYLLIHNKISNDEVSKYIINYLNSESKCLLIKSPYNTGKTTFLKNICERYERILFISYRITLSNNLLNNFESLGFKIYNEDINSKRLICQVDSLLKIFNYLNEVKYDLIIFDESESILNHFSATSLKNSYEIFQALVYLSMKAQKSIFLDGDLDNRTKNFCNKIDKEPYYIDNIIKKDIRNFIFTRSEKGIISDIKIKLENKKNVCIINMSERKANEIYETFKEYKSILYTSKTDDNDKKDLKDVSKIWKDYQLVIYSPTIESGVDFNEEHFNSIYVFMSLKSTSQRGLFQMINRIRKIENKNIMCFIGNIPIYENSAFLSYNELIKNYKLYFKEKFSYCLEENELKINNEKNELDLYDETLIYNEVEFLNKNSTFFLSKFIDILKKKKHSYEIVETIEKEEKEEKEEKDKVNIIHKRIAESTKITKKEYESLLILQAKQELKTYQKYQIQNYMYCHYYGDCTIDIVKKYYNEFGIFKRINNILNEDYFDEDTTKLMNEKKRCKYIVMRKFLEILKCNIRELLINNNVLDINEKMINDINNLKNTHKIYFNHRTKIIDIEKASSLVDFIKPYLNKYGITIYNESTVKKVEIDKKRVSKRVTTYFLKIEEEIKNKQHLYIK